MRKIVVLAVAIALLSVALTGCLPLMLMLSDDAETTTTSEVAVTVEQTTEATTPTTTAATAPIEEYLAYSVSEMVEDLESNALNAKEFYKGKKVEITGRVDVIDASGKYISLYPEDNEFSFTGVQCFVKNKEQLESVKKITKGDIVTIRGEITMVGEILGYNLNIHSFTVE